LEGKSPEDILNLEDSSTKQFYNLEFAMLATKAYDARFFSTRKGYLGRGPPGIQTADVVCMISGCDYPVILRRQESHYLLVGVCWILGLMDGEALEGVADGTAKVEEFEIW
jgi:hypothetical protein